MALVQKEFEFQIRRCLFSPLVADLSEVISAMSGDSSRGGVGKDAVGEGVSPRHRQERPDFDDLNGLGGHNEIVSSGGILGGDAGNTARFVRRKALVISFFEDGFRLDTQVMFAAAHSITHPTT